MSWVQFPSIVVFKTRQHVITMFETWHTWKKENDYLTQAIDADVRAVLWAKCAIFDFAGQGKEEVITFSKAVKLAYILIWLGRILVTFQHSFTEQASITRSKISCSWYGDAKLANEKAILELILELILRWLLSHLMRKDNIILPSTLVYGLQV